jgi:rhodanese-related sulfurtransferase
MMLLKQSCFILLASFSLLYAGNSNDNDFSRYSPFCGISCVYAALQINNISIDYKELISPRYVSSRKGSRLSDLKDAIANYHLYAENVRNITIDNIKQSNRLIILHVKSKSNSLLYDHYCLYIGDRDGKAYIYDPPNTTKIIPYYQLAPLWDGNGLIISDQPIDMTKLSWPAIRIFCYGIVFVLVCLITCHAAQRFFSISDLSLMRRIYFSGIQVAGITLCGIILGLMVHLFLETGFLAHPENMDGVLNARAGSFIHKVSTSKTQQWLDDKNKKLVLIDARYESDYKAGHLPNAQSLPVDCTDDQYKIFVAQFDKNTPILLYCQSTGCKFAEITALRLKQDGFKDISIFRGGWMEWIKSYPQTLK